MSLFQEDLLNPIPEAFVAAKKRQSKPKPVEPEDVYETVYRPVSYTLMHDDELALLSHGDMFIADVECYRNFFLAGFMHFASKKVIQFFDHDTMKLDYKRLEWFIQRFLLIGFNSKYYDLPLLQLACKGMAAYELKQCSDRLIIGGWRPYQLEQFYKMNFFPTNDIDLIEVLPLTGSLKLYAGRLHAIKMQELPIHHTASLTGQDIKLVSDYNFNDLELTYICTKTATPQLSLRYKLMETYRTDLRSKSDAQVAEAVVNSELQKLTGSRPERPKLTFQGFFYLAPSYISFNNPQLQSMLQTIVGIYFTVGDAGNLELPDEIAKLDIRIGKCNYKMGIGGLHSTEKSRARYAGDGMIFDRDVKSFYPRIILNQGLYPRHLGPAFLKIYDKIVKQRLAAKANKDKVTESSLKITINGSFGKFGNAFSTLYSPELLIQVTITGQLVLLMLIEMLEDAGIEVISANTDGVMIYCLQDQRELLNQVIGRWESKTNFETEEKQYSAVYSRDVNNYIAVPVEPGEDCKVKGAYSERGSAGDSVLSKNPENLIVLDAVKAFLVSGVAIEETIRRCDDIRRFVTIRNATGGAQKSGVLLGKVIRYYYSTEMKGIITKVKGGHKVPNSEGARPLMELPMQMPTDIDYDKYVRIAKDILIDVGAVQAPIGHKKSIGSLFDEDN